MVGPDDLKRDFPVRYSVAPGIAKQQLTIAGETEKNFTVEETTLKYPRAIMIVSEWLSDEDLLVKYKDDSSWTTLDNLVAKAFKEGGVYPLCVAAIKSSGATEVNFSILGIF